MSSELEHNKAIVAEFIEVVWRQGALDKLPVYWTADCVNHADQSGPNVGLDALGRYHAEFSQAFAGFADTTMAIEQQIAEGDRVVTQILTRARYIDTGKDVTLATIRIDRLAGGRIAEHWSVADIAGLMGQLAA